MALPGNLFGGVNNFLQQIGNTPEKQADPWANIKKNPMQQPVDTQNGVQNEPINTESLSGMSSPTGGSYFDPNTGQRISEELHQQMNRPQATTRENNPVMGRQTVNPMSQGFDYGSLAGSGYSPDQYDQLVQQRQADYNQYNQDLEHGQQGLGPLGGMPNALQLFQKLNDGSISQTERDELNRIKQENPEVLNQLNQSWKPTGPMGAPDNPPDRSNPPSGFTYGGPPKPVAPQFGYGAAGKPGDNIPGRDASFLDASNLAKKYSDSYQQSVTKDVYGEPVGGYGGESSDFDYDTDYSGETTGALPAGTSLGNSSQFGYGQQGGPAAPIPEGDPRIDAAQNPSSIMNQLNNAGPSGNIQDLRSPHSENYKVNLANSGQKMNLLDDAWNREQSNTVSNDVFQPDATATKHPTESEIGHAIGRDASPYQNMIGLAGNMTDGDPDQIKEMMNRIAWHESGMTMDPNQLQVGGGPGRGMYQFEGQSLPTAVNRSINAYKASGKEAPSWLQDINDQGITDATQLTPEVQSALALGNILSQSGSTNSLNQYFGGEGDISDLWADYHWQGDTADRNQRVESFNSHNRLYNGQGYEPSGSGYQFP